MSEIPRTYLFGLTPAPRTPKAIGTTNAPQDMGPSSEKGLATKQNSATLQNSKVSGLSLWEVHIFPATHAHSKALAQSSKQALLRFSISLVIFGCEKEN